MPRVARDREENHEVKLPENERKGFGVFVVMTCHRELVTLLKN